MASNNNQYGQFDGPQPNPNAYPAPQPEKKGKGLIIGLSILVGVLLIAAAIIGVQILKKNNAKSQPVYPVPAAAVQPAANNGESETTLDNGKTAETAPAEEGTAPAEAAIPAEEQASLKEEPVGTTLRIGMILDGDYLYDSGYNQALYEGLLETGRKFSWYATDGYSTEDYCQAMELAIEEGCNTLILQGFMFEEALVKVAPAHKDVTFILMDDTTSSLSWYDENLDLSNIVAVSYQEHLAGYLAGYAAVSMGYTKLGFLGGMAVPAVIRYGYGFIQGADDAAKKLGVSGVELRFAYANQFYGDSDITSAVDAWYSAGTEVVFSCGGGVYTSVLEAAMPYDGKIIGIDVDQAAVFDSWVGYSATVTSAVKAFGPSLKLVLDLIENGELMGSDVVLGMESYDPERACIRLAPSTQFVGGFTRDVYADLVYDLYFNNILVSSDTDRAPGSVASTITVIDLGNLK